MQTSFSFPQHGQSHWPSSLLGFGECQAYVWLLGASGSTGLMTCHKNSMVSPYPYPQRSSGEKLEAWKMQRPDSICAGQKQSSRRKQCWFFSTRRSDSYCRGRTFMVEKCGWVPTKIQPRRLESGGLDKADYKKRLIHLVSQDSILYGAAYIRFICVLLESFL